MTLPDLNPVGYKYRALRAGLRGWDVYALQTALAVSADGIFGPQTEAAVRACQERNALVRDGIAGVLTQREATLDLLWPVQREKQTPPGLLRGQIEHESSFWVGNHSLLYGNGSYDVGVCQRNTKYVDFATGFDAPGSVAALAGSTRRYFDKFAGVKSDEDGRRWGLAAGAWNRPAYACWIANEEGASVPRSETAQPSTSARELLEEYISDATVYAVW